MIRVKNSYKELTNKIETFNNDLENLIIKYKRNRDELNKLKGKKRRKKTLLKNNVSDDFATNKIIIYF